MSGKIRSSDIEWVKSQSNIYDVIADYVSLKGAGVDSFKGLCPFHDEKTPSFHVRPSSGFYHCFGCGESGDVISFLQKFDHLTFVEAIEKLASRLGFELTMESGAVSSERSGVSKTRILAANMAAQLIYSENLFSAAGKDAKKILNERGFDDEALKRFGVGFALPEWHALHNKLQTAGYKSEEMNQAGLTAQGARGPYDRFRGRITWPINDTSGQVVGFGARKINDSDEGPKYLNTPETSVYQKSKVLYGLNMAKKAISSTKTVVVVEGYTDVMACHLAGIETAVATCGTAFGTEHISLLRRMMGDDPSAQVIFTFDPDEAGIKAALKAFSQEHLFSAQTYIANSPEGFDPADVRLKKGEAALQSMFESKQPLFTFALKHEIFKFDLNSAAGRVSALKSAAPILARIKDSQMRREHAREVSNLLGFELSEVLGMASSAGSGIMSSNHDQVPPEPNRQIIHANQSSPGYRLEREAITAMVQFPSYIGKNLMLQAISADIFDADLRVIRDSIAANLDHLESEKWLEEISNSLPQNYLSLFHEIAVSSVPQKQQQQIAMYASGVVKSLLERDLLALKREMVSRLQRIDESNREEFRKTQTQISMLEKARRKLMEE